jgi:hypothetical protein
MNTDRIERKRPREKQRLLRYDEQQLAQGVDFFQNSMQD